MSTVTNEVKVLLIDVMLESVKAMNPNSTLVELVDIYTKKVEEL